jgi:hypothetical protein
MKDQATSLALIQDQLLNLQQFPTISTLPPSSSVPSTVEGADAMEEEAAVAVDTLSRNNQPTTDLEAELPEVEPRVPLRPTSDMRTGITATPMAETWMTPTPAQRAPGRVQGTTQTRPATTQWVAQALIFTRPSSHRQPAAPRPTCAPKRNNSSSNVRLYRTSRCRQCWPLLGSKRHLLSDMGGMPPTSYNGGQRLIMPNHHGPNMMNFVGQYPPAASAMQPGQQPTAGIFYPPPQQPGYF